MSIESKIKELLARKSDEQLNEEGMAPMGAASVKKDTSIAAANQGDTTMPRQGSSQDADYEEREEDEENQGAVASKSTPNSPRPGNMGAGQAPNYMTTADPTAVVNMKGVAEGSLEEISLDLAKRARDKAEYSVDMDYDDMRYRPYGYSEKQRSKFQRYIDKKEPRAKGDRDWDPPKKQASSGNKPMGESQEKTEGPSLKEQLSAIFGDDLSEDFRDKATAIFEAAVIARVNDEMEHVIEQLEEQKLQEMQDLTEGLVDKIDGFMNYVVEQWMQENELAVESGLRTEIAEDFISGLKTLFQEHYIEVPDDKVDVVEALAETKDELQEQLNTTLQKNIELAEELSNIKKALVLSEMTGDLADTEAEKLQKLLEGVQYDSESLFREKVKVIKENYFPKAQKSSPEEQLLTEEAPMHQTTDVMAKYAQALSRSVKVR